MLLGIIFLAILLYTVKTSLLYYGYLKSEKRINNSSVTTLKKVSVIVPARNEEHNIETCVRSIFDSNYPQQDFELVCINDRSEDNTLSILEKLKEEFENLKIVNITDNKQKGNLIGKAGALHQGIKAANGDIIMMTDADCTVNKDWISTTVIEFQKDDVALVPSFTLIKTKGMFSILQAVEWINMHSMAKSGIGLNMPLGCFGNNLSITKELYNKLGGYENIKFSVTEDYALLKASYQSGANITYTCSDKTSVTTEPCFTLKEYISQHRRWALGGLDLGWIAVFFVLASLGIWAALIIAAIKMNLFLFLSILFVRVFGDYLLIETSISRLKESKLRPYIIPGILFFMIVELIIPITMIKKEIKWKGQTFKA